MSAHRRHPLLLLIDYIWALGALVMCLGWWIGIVARDRDPLLIWLFYLPAPVVALAGFVWLTLTLRNRFRMLQLFVFATVVASLINVLIIDHRWHRPPDELPDNNIRILHWNTARGALGVSSIVQEIIDDIPDIILISEPPRSHAISDIASHALGMNHIHSAESMSLASHYPITFLGNIVLPSGAGWHAIVETDYGPLEVAAVDLVSHPTIDRRPAIQALTRWIDARTNVAPLVIAGDFNMRHDTASITPLKDRLDLAYLQHGRGWPYTWPAPFPVFMIDHMWISRDIRVNDYHLQRTRFSDHKRQIADVSFPDRRPRSGDHPAGDR